MKDFRVSIVIPTFNRSSELEVTLRSIFRQTLLPLEVIIVDASSDGASRNLVRSFQGEGLSVPLMLVSIPYPERNASRQRNIGISRAVGDFVAFLDDDIDLDEYYFEEIEKVFLADLAGRVGGVGGREKNVQVDVKSLRYRVESLFGFDIPGTVTRLGENTAHFAEGESPIKTEWLNGCNCVFRKEVFGSYAFEENFEKYSMYEDVAFSTAVAREWELLIQPRATLIHFFSKTNRLSNFEFTRMKVKNHYYMFKYFVPNKTGTDYVRLGLYWTYLLGFHFAYFLRLPTKNALGGLLGTILGIVEVVLRRYPRRSGRPWTR